MILSRHQGRWHQKANCKHCLSETIYLCFYFLCFSSWCHEILVIFLITQGQRSNEYNYVCKYTHSGDEEALEILGAQTESYEDLSGHLGHTDSLWAGYSNGCWEKKQVITLSSPLSQHAHIVCVYVCVCQNASALCMSTSRQEKKRVTRAFRSKWAEDHRPEIVREKQKCGIHRRERGRQRLLVSLLLKVDVHGAV